SCRRKAAARSAPSRNTSTGQRSSFLTRTNLAREGLRRTAPRAMLRAPTFGSLRSRAGGVNVRRVMAKHTYTVSAAQSQLPRLIRDAERGRPVAISRRDRTVAYILSQERLDAIVETMELLANPDAKKALDDHRSGTTRFLPLSPL